MPSVLYESYGATKQYSTPSLNAKHIRKFDREVWQPAEVSSDHRCLEIGCGTGHFLSFLAHKGVHDFTGIDQDPALTAVMPEAVRAQFHVADAFEHLAQSSADAPYDRVFLFDVLEHFSVEDGRRLLLSIKDRLADNGMIVLKMPNAGSPWGLQFQHGDLTHLTPYTPESIRQMGVSVGLHCIACYPHLLGSPRRQWTDRLVQRVLNKLVATPPEIWEGNFYALLRPSQ